MKLILAVLLILPFAIQTILPQEKSYLNLSLNDCITLAMENSKQKQIASTKIEVSKSHLKQAESGRWPSLELSSKAFIQDEPQNFIFPSSTFSFPPLEINLPPQDIKLLDNKSIMTDLTLVYPVFTGGKISSIIDQVEHSILISQNNLALTENEITLNVKKAYYAVILT
ncbi:MAG: TolC family protein, partial [Ignavibacteriaceae bacterium]